MKTSEYVGAIGLAALIFTAISCGPSLVDDAWGQAFGMIAATVDKADDARGLTVRSEPSDSGQPLGYLPIGSEIRACNKFKDGWVKLDVPARGGWINMSNLKPLGGQGKVVAVDAPDLCLIIRKGPGSSYERVGCAELGQQLNLAGVWSENNWARLDDGGWVDAVKIDTDLMTCQTPPDAQPPTAQEQEPPPAVSSSRGEEYGNVETPSPSYQEYPVPYFLGDYGGYGYYSDSFPYGGVIVVCRRFKCHHHHHHHHHFDRGKDAVAVTGATNRRTEMSRGPGNTVPLAPLESSKKRTGVGTGVSTNANWGSVKPNHPVARFDQRTVGTSGAGVTPRLIVPSYSRIPSGASQAPRVGLHNNGSTLSGFSRGSLEQFGGGGIRSSGFSSGAIRSGGLGIGGISSGGFSLGGGSPGGGGHRK